MATEAAALLFVPDNEFVWLAAEQLSVEDIDGNIQVKIQDYVTASVNKTINIKSLPLGMTSFPLQNANLTSVGVDDMCSLSYLHEPSIMDNLIRRFHSKLPYTYTGDICIAVSRFFFLE